MKRTPGIVLLTLGLALLLVPLFAGTAAAQITGSAHDLSLVTDTNTDPLIDLTATSRCTACHYPHSAAGSAVLPLSNRNGSGQTFTMYSSATLDMSIAASPNESSLFCLSCHDGVTALNSWINGPNAALATSMPAGAGVLGTDLSDDHPVSITYNNGLDSDFLVAPANLPLKSGAVECATCHDPHDTTEVKFLRMSPATICGDCHTK